MGKSSEKQKSMVNFMKIYYEEYSMEVFNEFFKTPSSRALNCHISEDKAKEEILNGLLPRVIADMHAAMAEKMMRNEKNAKGSIEYEFKVFLFEIERTILKAAQDTEFQQLIMEMTKDKDTFVNVTIYLRERIEEFGRYLNEKNLKFQAMHAFYKNALNLVRGVLFFNRK